MATIESAWRTVGIFGFSFFPNGGSGAERFQWKLHTSFGLCHTTARLKKKRGVLGVARHHKQKRRERSGCGGGRFKFRYFSIPSFFFLLASSFSVGRTIPVFSFYTRGAPEYKNPKGRSQTTTGSNLNHGVEKKDEIGINARIFLF